MKLEQLFETLQIKDTTEMAEYLLANCAPYLKDIKFRVAEKVMYRGMDVDKRFIIKTSRQNGRRPMSMLRSLHFKINDYFEGKFGFPYRNGVFTTGRVNVAKGYGVEFAIFPIGDYECLWSRDVMDLYGDFEEFEFNAGNTADEDREQFMKEIVEHARWTEGDITGAIETQHEIMIKTKEYMAIDLESFDLGALEKEIRKYK